MVLAGSVCLWASLGVYAQDEPVDDDAALTNLPDETANVCFIEVPDEVEDALALVVEYAERRSTNIGIASLRTISDFVESEARSDSAWRLQTRWDAQGAAMTMVLTGAFDKGLQMNFSTNVPDFALFPCSLRYSAPLDHAAFLSALQRCVATQMVSNAFASASYLCTEETSPNPQSGTSYVYTNLRSLVRVNLGSRNALFSFSGLQGVSDIAIRGVSVGPPEKHLYYYSDKQGTNIRGLYWVKPRMFISKTLVVYQEAGPAEMAVAVFSWIRAGWKGINVTRPHHIYSVMATVRDMRQQFRACPAASVTGLVSAAGAVASMPDAEINRLYRQYCDFVKAESEKNRNPLTAYYNPASLANLYNANTIDAVDMPHRRAVVVQERMRALLGIPTWSAPTVVAPDVVKSNNWQFWKK